VQRPALESPKARTARAAAGRSRHGSAARRHLACYQKRAQAQQQTLLFVDESGCYPLPSVVRPDAPIGQTPMWREWRTRDKLSAIRALSPEGTRYFHGQEGAIDSADVVAFLEHLLREVPSRMVVIWGGAPIHRRHRIKEFLANGAAQRLHLERLPAYAPELNPDEGLWQQLKGVEWRHLGCVDRRHLWHARRTAVKRVRRKPRLLKGCFAGAGL
jgi:transposase